ncbi:MAG: glycoside hydrolase family 43 protein [Abitibacteriaceae bacterium]|nr:glycoside hydrolase family 43 protein [Abditibacteriaceae bacterium]MBV9866232.1 glycoside hydrolase family 43 protein [Abditibacteriaceae bacterium]
MTNSCDTHDGLYALAYFRQIYGGQVEVNEAGETHTVTLTNEPLAVESLHLAWSRDGRHWTALNDNQPVLPNVWLRDPFINRGADGWFHLLATGGESARDCLYLRSRDLLNWDEPQSLPLMESVPQANNVWAPEWFFDAQCGEYFLLWSSSFEDAGWKNSRLWCCYTSDFQTFSKPSVLFEPPYSVIDGTLLLHNGTYYLFHKEEEFGASKGERRAIRLATSPSIEGPYTLHSGPLNEGAHGGQIVPVITEGPAVMPDPQSDGWLLLYDFCMGNDYGISYSPDLWQWREESDVSFPPNARHGSAFAITEDELMGLQRAFSASAL